MGSFRVGQITVNLAGAQEFTLYSHPVTRAGKANEVLVVGASKLLVYVYDLAAARGFAVAARTALGCVPPGFATRAVAPGGDDEEELLAPAIVLRCAGGPRVNRVQGFGSAHGTPRVRLQTDYLTVHLFDRASLESWMTGWTDVEHRARELWPDPDASPTAEARERDRIAGTGKATKRPAA